MLVCSLIKICSGDATELALSPRPFFLICGLTAGRSYFSYEWIRPECNAHMIPAYPSLIRYVSAKQVDKWEDIKVFLKTGPGEGKPPPTTTFFPYQNFIA